MKNSIGTFLFKDTLFLTKIKVKILIINVLNIFIIEKTTGCSRKKKILMKVGITFLTFDLIHSVHLKILQEPY
jgi:hypothetical protein